MIDEIGAICGRTSAGSRSAARASLLGDDLPIDVDVGAPGELDVDDRESDARRTADGLHARRSVEDRFERERDQRFDFLRRQARRFGHDRDARPIEIGKDVDRQVTEASSRRRPAPPARRRSSAGDTATTSE